MLPQNETKYKPVPTLSEPALSSPRLKAGASRSQLLVRSSITDTPVANFAQP
jgi:hypothetical protein